MDVVGGCADAATAVVATLLLRLVAVAISMATGDAGRLEAAEGDGGRAGAALGATGATHEAAGVRAGLPLAASPLGSRPLDTREARTWPLSSTSSSASSKSWHRQRLQRFHPSPQTLSTLPAPVSSQTSVASFSFSSPVLSLFLLVTSTLLPPSHQYSPSSS